MFGTSAGRLLMLTDAMVLAGAGGAWCLLFALVALADRIGGWGWFE